MKGTKQEALTMELREDRSQERVSLLEMPGHFRGRSYNESHIHDQGTAKNDNDCIT